jgi:hypothetical protein
MNKTPVATSSSLYDSVSDRYGPARYLKHLRELWLETKPRSSTTAPQVFFDDLPSIRVEWLKLAAIRDAQCLKGDERSQDIIKALGIARRNPLTT